MIMTTYNEFLDRLQVILIETKAGRSIERMRLSVNFFTWFHRTEDQEKLRRANTLSAYKFLPRDIELRVDYYDLGHLIYKNISEGEVEEFKENSVFVLPPISSFARQDNLKSIAKVEFDMYLYYHRLLRHEKSTGKLHNMVFSITQQIAQQDPALYLACVSLREDHETRLISYPQCAKYIRQGEKINATYMPAIRSSDNSYVRAEICFNSDKEGRSYEIIDNHDDTFRHSIADWAQHHRASGANSESLEAFLETQKYAWRPVPVKNGVVIFTASWMPTRLSYNATTSHCSIAVDFTAIKDGGETLENGGSWSTVANSHRDFEILSPL
jgi:hypothetical protein